MMVQLSNIIRATPGCSQSPMGPRWSKSIISRRSVVTQSLLFSFSWKIFSFSLLLLSCTTCCWVTKKIHRYLIRTRHHQHRWIAYRNLADSGRFLKNLKYKLFFFFLLLNKEYFPVLGENRVIKEMRRFTTFSFISFWPITPDPLRVLPAILCVCINYIKERIIK